MEMIFQDAKDKYVTAVVVFGNAEDNKLYIDAEFETQVDQAIIEDAFNKNVLMVKVDGASFRPVKVDANKVLVVDFVSNAVKATEFLAKAAE